MQRRVNGVPVEVGGVWTDITSIEAAITERKRAEATMRLQSAALNAAANAILITNRDGAIEWVNRAFTAETGYTLDEAIGRNPRELMKSGVHDAAFYAHMWKTLTAGDVWIGELTNRRKDGTLNSEEQTITPVRIDGDEITHFIGVKRDLTEQKRLQEQFVQAQKMEIVGRLAGGVAHDFNNLLTVINGRSDLAMESLAADDPMRAEFAEIQEAGERAARLTRQLLTFSRKQIIHPTILDVGTEVANAAQMIRRLIGEDITLIIRASGGAPHDCVLADRGHFEQVLLNLAVNARDAMPDGGSLTIQLDAVDAETMDLELGLSPGAHVRLTVTDTGIGMTDDVRRRIFEPFFTTKAPGKGTGLGLATVQAIVAQHHGAITVTSAPGRGTAFHVFLPRVTDPATAPHAAAHAVARGHETILLVEDDRALRELAATMLRSAGYTVLAAENGAVALATLRSAPSRIDVIVTDIVMPEMSGTELATHVRREAHQLPVLFISGYADDRITAGSGTDAGHVLPKPFSAAELTHAVRRLLDHQA